MSSFLRKLCAFALFLPFFLSYSPAFGENELTTASPAPVQTTSLGYAIDLLPIGENLCALTFDDGPSRLTTPQLLKTLDKYGIPATFFVLGKNANFAPEIVQQEVAEGHEVGVHTYTHANLRAVSSQRKKDEIVRSLAVLNSLGIEPKVLRPPYGNRNAEVDELSHSFGMEVVLWSHDTLDWKRLPEDYSKLPSGVKGVAAPGRMHGIILMHDIHQRSVDDVPRAIEQLKAAGCQRFVTVSDYLDTLFNDPEPSFLMTRHPAKKTEKLASQESVAEQSPQASPKASSQEQAQAPSQAQVQAQSQEQVQDPSQAQAPFQKTAPQNESIKVSLHEVLTGDVNNQARVSLQEVLTGSPHAEAKPSSQAVVAQAPEEIAKPSSQAAVAQAPEEIGKLSSQAAVAQASEEIAKPSSQAAVAQASEEIAKPSLQETEAKAPHNKAVAESTQDLAKEPSPKVEKQSYPPIAKVHVGTVSAKILAVQHEIAPRMVGTGYLANEEGKKTQLRPWSGFVGDDLSLHPAKLEPVHIQSGVTSLIDSMKRFF